MPALRKRPDRGDHYELDYTDVDGNRYRIDTGTRDLKIGRIWLQKVEELLSLSKLGIIKKVGRLTREVVAGQAAPGTQERLRLDQFEEKYLERGEHDLELAEGTLELIKNAFAAFRNSVGNSHLDAITDENVRRWKREMANLGRAKTTTAIYQRALKTAFTRAVKWKWAEENPFAEVEIPSARKGEKPAKSMTIEEVQLLLSVINDQRFKYYVQMLLYSACRRNEILYLKREDIDLDQQILTVHVSKTHRTLQLPINKALLKVIEEMKESGALPKSGYLFTSGSNRKSKTAEPWHPSSATHWFKEYLRLAGLPEHYSLHSTRHTFVTHLRSKGIPQDVIQRLCGHTSPATTDIYDSSTALFFRHFADMVDYEPAAAEPPKT